MAATIFSSVKNDDKLLVASRGMVVLFDEPYNPKAVAVCAAHDMIMPNNPATQISADDFGNDTLVLTMSDAQKNKIYAEFDNAINVYTLAEYAGRPEDYEVMDPCGKVRTCYRGSSEDELD